MNTKYYTRQQVLDAGIPQVSLDRWSRQFRGTPMVIKRQGQRLLYSEDFIRFLDSRMGKVGPANLPAVPIIAQLYQGVRGGQTLSQLATQLKLHPAVVQAFLTELDLEVTHAEKE